MAIDAAGNGNIEITGFTPQYVTMQYTRGRRTLYLDPNQDLTLSFDSDNMWRNTTFEGAGAAINTYLGSKELQSLGMPDMKMQEAALIHKGTACTQPIAKYWKPQNFQPISLHRKKYVLQFYTYYYFSKYALYHPHFGKDDNYIPSKAYYEKLEAITPINAGLLALKEYKAFLPDAISAFSNKRKIREEFKLEPKIIQVANSSAMRYFGLTRWFGYRIYQCPGTILNGSSRQFQSWLHLVRL